MPLCVQGNASLSDIFNLFSRHYVEKHSGCNGNDVDRAFLHMIINATGAQDRVQRWSASWLGVGRHYMLTEQIEKIR